MNWTDLGKQKHDRFNNHYTEYAVQASWLLIKNLKLKKIDETVYVMQNLQITFN
jgi:hypothetical protein